MQYIGINRSQHFVLNGTKPLPETILTYHQSFPVPVTCEQLLNTALSHYLKQYWLIINLFLCQSLVNNCSTRHQAITWNNIDLSSIFSCASLLWTISQHGTKPLPETILTYHQSFPVPVTCEQFLNTALSHYLKQYWLIINLFLCQSLVNNFSTRH